LVLFFFFNDTATTEIYTGNHTLSLHDALPICTGAYGGYLPWVERAGRFRSVGDGEIDFPSIFAKLAQYDYDGWAVLEWECCLKDSAAGAREGAERIADWIIPVASRAFDDFAATGVDKAANRKALGLD